jgi:hypothetical protein
VSAFSLPARALLAGVPPLALPYPSALALEDAALHYLFVTAGGDAGPDGAFGSVQAWGLWDEDSGARARGAPARAWRVFLPGAGGTLAYDAVSAQLYVTCLAGIAVLRGAGGALVGVLRTNPSPGSNLGGTGSWLRLARGSGANSPTRLRSPWAWWPGARPSPMRVQVGSIR